MKPRIRFLPMILLGLLHAHTFAQPIVPNPTDAGKYLIRDRAQGADRFSYQSPEPGSIDVSPATNIIVRYAKPLEKSTLLTPSLFMVQGSMSGLHSGKVVLSDDQRTVVFNPDVPFALAETVNVVVGAGIKTENNEAVAQFSFDFVIAPTKVDVSEPTSFQKELEGLSPYSGNEGMVAPLWNRGKPTLQKAGADTLPLDFPYIRASVFDTTSPGRIFLSNFSTVAAPSTGPYLLILENSGQPFFYRRMASTCHGFTLQPDGTLTYMDTGLNHFVVLDTSYNQVNTFACGNGYKTDVHELRVLPNGHVLLLGTDPHTVDMSKIVSGGNTAATVIGIVIQELDRNKNVVFQWRTWDHFQITDATHEDLTASSIDYNHANAIEFDTTDGNLLLSSRHMDEITKISRETGNIIWRWGGKNNQFTSINDPVGFSHQHAVRRIPNGHITLFDNGNFHNPPFSRAVEYQLDEQNKTATLVWQYRNTPDIYGQAMGYVQRFSNGNTLIGWGATNPAVTEVRSDGTKVFELAFCPGVINYRAFRFRWKPEIQPTQIGAGGATSVSDIYPNPFTSTTNIVVALPKEAIVTLKIFDVLGRMVATLADGDLRSAGIYAQIFDGSRLASGVYIYHLEAGDVVETKRIVHLK